MSQEQAHAPYGDIPKPDHQGQRQAQGGSIAQGFAGQHQPGFQRAQPAGQQGEQEGQPGYGHQDEGLGQRKGQAQAGCH